MAKDNTVNKVATVEDLSVQIAILKDDIAALTGTIGDYSKAQTKNVAEHAKSTAQHFADTAQDLANDGRAKASQAQDSAEEFIRTQPATALGIAAGVGFLVGLISARR